MDARGSPISQLQLPNPPPPSALAPPVPPPPPALPSPANPDTRLMHKNRLQEYTQRACLRMPVYQTLMEGTSKQPRFRSTVWVEGDRYVTPDAFPTRKSAEQEVARIALEAILEKAKIVGFPLILQDNVACKSTLHEYAARMNLRLPTYRTLKQEGLIPVFRSTVDFNGVSTEGDSGRTKKEAEQLAARAVILSLLGDPTSALFISEIIKSKLRLYDALNKAKHPPYEVKSSLVASVPLDMEQFLGADSHSVKRAKTNNEEEPSDNQGKTMPEGVKTGHNSDSIVGEEKGVKVAVVFNSMPADSIPPAVLSATMIGEGKEDKLDVVLDSMPEKVIPTATLGIQSPHHNSVPASAMLLTTSAVHLPQGELVAASAVQSAAPEMHSSHHDCMPISLSPLETPGVHPTHHEHRSDSEETAGQAISLPVTSVNAKSEQLVGAGTSPAQKRKRNDNKASNRPPVATVINEEKEVQAAMVLDSISARATAPAAQESHPPHHAVASANSLTLAAPVRHPPEHEVAPASATPLVAPEVLQLHQEYIQSYPVPPAAPGMLHLHNHLLKNANAERALEEILLPVPSVNPELEQSQGVASSSAKKKKRNKKKSRNRIHADGLSLDVLQSHTS